MPRYKCSNCNKEFIGDYGLGMFPCCSVECKAQWRERFAEGIKAYVEFDKRRENKEGEK